MLWFDTSWLRKHSLSRKWFFFPPALCLTGCLKKGARLELSLVHLLFNLGNNKNIKWIPVFLCYNRSTTEWTRRDSETKQTTSERNERVEEEGEKGTKRRAGRWQERPSEQAGGESRCPCRVEEGSQKRRRRVVQLLRETGEISMVFHGNPNEAQLLTK